MRRIRVAQHVHSDWSYDGTMSLESIAAAFGRRGYDAVLLSEHDRDFDERRWDEYRAACARAAGACLLVPGIEYREPTNCVHVPVYGDLPFLGRGLQTGELLRRARESEGMAVLAHPARRGAWRTIDRSLMGELFGVELWNRRYDGYAPSREGAGLLASHRELAPVVALDFHTARQFHPLAMVIELDGELCREGIWRAMRERRVTPTAFGLPAERFARGPVRPAVAGIERLRREAAARARGRGRGRRATGAGASDRGPGRTRP